MITGNVAYESGGGIASDGGSYVIMSNPTFSLNEAKWEGGALYSGSGTTTLQGFYATNPVFDSNIADYGFADVWLWPNKTYQSVRTNTNPTGMPTPKPTSNPTGTFIWLVVYSTVQMVTQIIWFVFCVCLCELM